MKKRILHVISGLSDEVDEKECIKLLSGFNPIYYKIEVVMLNDNPLLSDKINQLGINVSLFLIKNPFWSPLQLKKKIVSFAPHLVHCHNHLAYSLVVLLGVSTHKAFMIVWSIYKPPTTKGFSLFIHYILSSLSKYLQPHADKVIYRTIDSAMHYFSRETDASKTVVIPTGVDLKHYARNEVEGERLRRRLSVSDNTVLIGNIKSDLSITDCHSFLYAAQLLCQEKKGVEFVLAGKGFDWSNDDIKHLISHYSLEGRVHLLGHQVDWNDVYNALDIATLYTITAPDPTSIIEAMASETSCVAVDYGDTAFLLDNTGIVVCKDNYLAMMDAWIFLLNETKSSRQALGKKARMRCQDKFTLSRQTRAYECLYSELIEQKTLINEVKKSVSENSSFY